MTTKLIIKFALRSGKKMDMATDPIRPSKQLPEKFVYFFAAGESEGNSAMKNTLGGKGANLCEMTALGLPVPPGFTISTEMCAVFYQCGQSLPQELKNE